MSTLISVIGALLVLTVLVFFHELGHFMMGRRLGFRIDEFAIGMGPVVVSREKGGTRYAIRALPIGGMCMFHGEDEAGDSDPGCFTAQPVWKRILVVAAGPAMNILLAVVIAVAILMAYGDFMPGIVDFAEGYSPAREAGIMEGDIIVQVDGRKITYYTECSDAIRAADSDAAEVVVYREGERLAFTVRDIYNQEEGANMLGIFMSPVRLRYGLFEAIGNSVSYVWNMMVEMVGILGSMVTQGVESGDVAGPVGTISLIGQAVRAGFEVVLRLGVLISVNLGIMNILPLPALDGGRLAFMFIEAIRGKAIPPEKEGMVHMAGMIMLLALMALLTVMDVRNLFNGAWF